MDKSIEDMTMLFLSLMAVREETPQGIRQRAPITFPQQALAALQDRGLIIAGDDGKITLTEAGVLLGEDLEDRYLDAGAHPDVVL